MRMHIVVLIVGLLAPTAGLTENEFQLSIGKTWGRFTSSDEGERASSRLNEIHPELPPIVPSDDLSLDVFHNDSVSGYKLEIGYVWDIGKPGGFRTGLTGAYIDFEDLSKEIFIVDDYRNPIREYKQSIDTLTIRWVGEQDLSRWCRFFFKIGLAGSEDYGGASSEIGFTFRLVDPLWLSLSYEDVAFFDIGSQDADVYVAAGGTLALNFRF